MPHSGGRAPQMLRLELPAHPHGGQLIDRTPRGDRHRLVLKIDVLLMLQRRFDLMPQRPHRHGEHRLAGAQQLEHLLAGGALMHVTAIAHDGHIGQLGGASLGQKTDGRRHVLQIDAGVKQFLGHGENHHILERVQATRTGPMGRRDGRLDDLFARPVVKLPDRDPRNVLTDTWRVVPDDRLVTFKPDALPESWRISTVRRNAADLCLVVNDPVTGEPVEPDLMALLRDGCFDFDRSRETPEWQGFWRSERGTVAYRDASGLVRRWTPGMMKPTHGKGNANRGHVSLHLHSQLSYTGLAAFGRLRSKPLINMASNR